MKNLFLSIGLLGLSTGVFAQLPALKPGDVQVSVGPQVYSANRVGSLTEYQNLFNGSSLLPGDFSQYSKQSFFSVSGSGSLFLGTGWYFRNKDKTAYKSNMTLRTGLTYFSSYGFNNNLIQTSSTPYDTLKGSNGTMYPVDSTYNHSISFGSQSQNLVLDVAMIFRTTSAKRFSLYGGLGVQAGASFNRIATLRSDEYSYLSFADNSGFLRSNSNDYHGKSETKELKSSLVMGFYVPLGMDLQLGKKREFWKQLHVFGEMRPGMMVTGRVSNGYAVNPGMSFQLGVKVKFL
ncbi:MAG: hypothetical protein GC180_04450 [Bacteroidetes bacterium]|nr:hypothetical protein [Bacteroidota bacterium]